MGIYLDYNASAPIDPRVLSVMIDTYQNHFGNADSRTHAFGDDVRILIEQARKQVAELLNVDSGEIIFTSGATESNNLAVLGLRDYGEKHNRKHIITSRMEHKAILEATRHLENAGFVVQYINPENNGRIDVEKILSSVQPDTLLVSLMHVNNETGIIQPVAEIGSVLAKKGIIFHVDATQSCGKLIDEIKQLNYDLMSISAHKMHGPQGIGALVMKKKKYKYPPVSPIMFGGGQEHGMRPGTLPAALICGFGEACQIAMNAAAADLEHCREIKIRLVELLKSSGVNYVVNGAEEYCIPSTINLSFSGVSSEALMLATKQYCGVSNGSACSTRSYNQSHVLSAMHLPDDRIESAIRISWGRETDLESFTKEFSNLLQTVKEFQ